MPHLGPRSSDETLAAAAQCGCGDSWSLLTQRYHDRLIHFLWHRTAQPADAEDLAQETLLRAWDRLDQFTPNRRFAAWLFTIAARIAIDHHRRQAARPTVPLSEQVGLKRGPDEQLSRLEQRDNLWALAARVLTADQYEATWLRYGEDLEPREIAEVMNRPGVSVRVLLLRSRKRLEAALKETDRIDLPTPTMASVEPAGGAS